MLRPWVPIHNSTHILGAPSLVWNSPLVPGMRTPHVGSKQSKGWSLRVEYARCTCTCTSPAPDRAHQTHHHHMQKVSPLVPGMRAPPWVTGQQTCTCVRAPVCALCVRAPITCSSPAACPFIKACWGHQIVGSTSID